MQIPKKFLPWETYFQYTRMFFEQYGHLLVEKGFVIDGVSLGNWIRYQRSRKSSKHLSDAQIKKLDSIGMVWQVREHDWQTMYNAAKKYVAEYGNLPIAKGHMVNGRDLFHWLQGNRKTRHALPIEKKVKLEEIGIVWTKTPTYKRRPWEYGYQRATLYRQRNGHLRVPEKYKDEDQYTLGTWIRAQREHYKKGTLPKARIVKLEKIDMLWRVDQRVQTSFNEQACFYYLKRLFPDAKNRDKGKCGCELDIFIPSINVGVEYDSLQYHGEKKMGRDIRKNQICRGNIFLIRIRHKESPILGGNDPFIHYITFDHHENVDQAIVETLAFIQNKFYINTSSISVNMTRDSSLISEQMINLVDRVWSKKLSDAKDFFQKYNHLDIPDTYWVNGYSLGNWLHDQRKAYKKNRLPPYKKDALEAMDVKWSYLKETWHLNYNKVKAHYEKFGNTKFCLTLSDEERSLYHWVNDQVKLLRRNRINPERIKLLREVGITAIYSTDKIFLRMCTYLRQFRDARGHCIVPRRFRCDDGTRLGSWVQNQRRLYQKGELTEARMRALTDIGFCPHNYHDVRFYHWLELLRVYLQENGHIRVSQSFCAAHGERLGKFINAMRVKYRCGELSPRRIALLEDLGMVWEPRALVR